MNLGFNELQPMMSDFVICFIFPIKFFKDFLGVFCLLLVAFAAGILINERLGLPYKLLDQLHVFVF